MKLESFCFQRNMVRVLALSGTLISHSENLSLTKRAISGRRNRSPDVTFSSSRKPFRMDLKLKGRSSLKMSAMLLSNYSLKGRTMPLRHAIPLHTIASAHSYEKIKAFLIGPPEAVVAGMMVTNSR